jgi:integrase/recombinase XerD
VFDLNGGRKYLNKEERQAYLGVIRGESNDARRAFLMTLFYTGCRISEGLDLRVGRVDFAAKMLIFETLKRRKRGIFRAVPIPDELVSLFRNIILHDTTDARVWQFSRSTGYRMIKAKMQVAQVSGGMAMPKGLRHGYGVACVSVKVPPPMIQRWLGHARLETTAIYLDVHGEEERELAMRVW